MSVQEFDILIVGGGVSGTALFHTLCLYTDVPRIALLEKYDKLAAVNSARTHNSQTLHFGDIETNYTYQKAEQVKFSVDMVRKFLDNYRREGGKKQVFSVYSKMVLAVGEKQVRFLSERYDSFKKLFPNLKKIDRGELAKIEPKVVEGRDSHTPLLAMVTTDGYTVDFAALSELFVEKALSVKENQERAQIFLQYKVDEIKKEGDSYTVTTNKGTFRSKVVVVAAGGHSLLLAKQMGYGSHFALLSIAGSFFWAPKMLNGKVYTIQVDKLPFAAVHGDPDVYNANETRFGPTAKAIPMLERYNWKSLIEYFQTVGLTWSAIMSFVNILSDGIVLRYILKNFLYDIPFLGKYLFLLEVRKIIPTIKYGELRYAKGMGGTRPQIVNTRTKKLEMGEAKIEGDNIIFNITPSPGASTCLGNAYRDVQKIMDFFQGKYHFHKETFEDYHIEKENHLH